MEASALANSLISFLSGFDGLTAYTVILGLLLVCGLGVPLPEDITLIGAGFLAAAQSISLPGAVIAGFIGVLAGDTILFFMGRWYGRAVFELPGFRKVFTPERIAMAEKKVLHNSKFICFTARFLPGLRAPIYLTSGIMGVKPSIFLALDGLAALLSVPIWVVGGWWFAVNFDIDMGLEYAKKAQFWLVVVVATVIFAYVAWRKIRRRKVSSPSEGQD